MKLLLNRADFLNAAKQLCKVAPAPSPVQSITGILLEVDEENLEVTLTATNLETTISCNLSAAVYEGGSVIVNAALFAEMLRRFGEPTVAVELLKNQQLSLMCGKANYLVGTLPAKDFPNLPVLQPEYVGEIVGLPSLVKSTAFLVSRGSSSDPKHCVRLDFSGKFARTISTDGTRMMSCKKPLPSANKKITLLLPVNAFTLLASFVDEGEALHLKSSKQYVAFQTGQMTFTIRLGLGSYIDADSVLAGITGCYQAIVDSKALHEVLDIMDAVAVAGDQLRMVFQLDGISLESNSERARSKSHVLAQVAAPMLPEGFYYPLKNTCQGLFAMNGMLKLSVTTAGLLLAETDGQSFLQTPVRYKEKALKKPENRKEETVEKPAKKTKTKKSASKAA